MQKQRNFIWKSSEGCIQVNAETKNPIVVAISAHKKLLRKISVPKNTKKGDSKNAFL